MDYFALLLPVLLIIGLFAGLVILKRRLFDDGPEQAPLPIPDLPGNDTGVRTTPAAADSAARPAAQSFRPAAAAGMPFPRPFASSAGESAGESAGVSLTPARLYPRRVLPPVHKAIFSRLLKALPGYVVLPGIAFDRFLEARDGTASENTSLQNRAGQQLADFVVCDRKLNVLLVCQVEDGTVLPARIQEREKMLQRAGLRLLRWNVESPPDPGKLLNTVRTLEKLSAGSVNTSG